MSLITLLISLVMVKEGLIGMLVDFKKDFKKVSS
jgi:hypothetical protein